jgi:hypothetical protein
MPAPILPVRVGIPDESYLELPYDDEGVKRFLDYEWEEIDDWCSPEYPVYKHYMQNRLFPKLLQAAQHYIAWLQTRDDEATRVLLNRTSLNLGWIENFIGNWYLPDDVAADRLYDIGWQSDIVDAVLDRIYGLVDAVFNHDLLNVRQIAFNHGQQLRLYADTQQGWVITPLGQAVQNLPDVEAVAFLLVIETMRAMLDQDERLVSRQQLQWLLDENPARFDIYARSEESPISEALKRDDTWLRRLRWLGIVAYTHRYDSSDFPHISGFNQRQIDLTPIGELIIEAILEKPSILDVELISPDQASVPNELREIREMISGLYVLLRALQTNFGEIHRSFEQKLSKIEDATLRDQAYQQVYEDLHQLVVKSLAQIHDRIREYERGLIEQVGEDTWAQLAPNSRHFLSSAEYLYGEHRGARILDFAPAAVEYCKVVETELNDRLSCPLLKFLHDHVGPVVELQFGGEAHEQRTDPKARPPSLGQVAHLLKASRKPAEKNQVVRDFLERSYASEIQEFILRDLPGKLLTITKEFRNGAAHAEALSQEKVEDFREILIGSEDGSDSLLRQIVRIQSGAR